MVRLALASLLLVVGCTRQQAGGVMPQLRVVAAASWVRRAGTEGQDVLLRAELGWRLDEPDRVRSREVFDEGVAPGLTASPCEVPPLCLWERRERERAVRRARGWARAEGGRQEGGAR